MSSVETITQAVRSIAQLREEMGLTQAAFASRIGLANKATVSLLERGLIPCSPDVALAIESLSGGRIDAAELNDVVARARHPLSSSTTEGAAS